VNLSSDDGTVYRLVPCYNPPHPTRHIHMSTRHAAPECPGVKIQLDSHTYSPASPASPGARCRVQSSRGAPQIQKALFWWITPHWGPRRTGQSGELPNAAQLVNMAGMLEMPTDKIPSLTGPDTHDPQFLATMPSMGCGPRGHGPG
jgi:hypothetical protein